VARLGNPTHLPGALHTVATQHISTLHSASGRYILCYIPAQVKHPPRATTLRGANCALFLGSRARCASLQFDHARARRVTCSRTNERCAIEFAPRARDEGVDVNDTTTRDAPDRFSMSMTTIPSSTSSDNAHNIYLGVGEAGWSWAGPQRSTLVLGPSRSGKTSSLVIPNLLLAKGPVVSTSTKPDVMEATSTARHGEGWCFLFDPSGEIECPPHVERIGWSPLTTAARWDAAV
jgi:hypothetical protein